MHADGNDNGLSLSTPALAYNSGVKQGKCLMCGKQN